MLAAPVAFTKNSKIVIRADLNTPLTQTGAIASDERLRAFLPSLKAILERGCGRITLLTHLGRPQGYDDALSTKQLAAWLTEHGVTTRHQKELTPGAQGEVVMLENLRFWPEEQQGNLNFARQLAMHADHFIFDAFATAHRTDASVAVLPTLFKPENRSLGSLVTKEISALTTLRTNPKKPFVLVLGGKKVKDKLPLISALIAAPAQRRPTHILLGGLLGWELKKSEQQKLFLEASAQGIEIACPTDYVMAADGSPIDIGADTVRSYLAIINRAATIFANGTMGIWEKKESAAGSFLILQGIAQSSSYKLIGGGDCIAAAEQARVLDRIDFVSTGGGATLAFLAAQEVKELPGLACFL